DRASWFYTSILFQWNTVGITGPLLVVFAMAGAVLNILRPTSRTLQIFAITLLTYFCTRISFAFLTITFDFWRGPSPLYFEFFVIPLYAIFAVQFFARVLARIWHRRGWSLPAGIRLEAGLVGAAVTIMLALAATTPNADQGFHYPPAATPITDS